MQALNLVVGGEQYAVAYTMWIWMGEWNTYRYSEVI